MAKAAFFVSLLIAMSPYSMLSGTSMDSYDDLVRSATRLCYRYDIFFGFEPIFKLTKAFIAQAIQLIFFNLLFHVTFCRRVYDV